MQRDKAIRHRDQTIRTGAAEQLVKQNHIGTANRFPDFRQIGGVNIAAAGFDDERRLVVSAKCSPKSAKNADRILAMDLAVEIEHEKENVVVFRDIQRSSGEGFNWTDFDTRQHAIHWPRHPGAHSLRDELGG